MKKQEVIHTDLGLIAYKNSWDLQEKLMQENLAAKQVHKQTEQDNSVISQPIHTTHHFLLCEHPPVYTLGRNGDANNILISAQQLRDEQIEYYKINRGGDITFHGPGQIVGYPILDLEKFYTDIGRYIYSLEEVIIRSLAAYGIIGGRSKGETGVWLDAAIPSKARKICAIGIRCSRWITMHGFALNVNTQLDYFNNIIPCGIADKQVTSMHKELGAEVSLESVKETIVREFETIFGVAILQAKYAG